MPTYHLAQLNIAKLKFALDDPQMSGFVERLDDINALADKAPGFVWRLQTETGDATAIDYFGPEYLVNMSVWTSRDALHDYVYRSAHSVVMAQRKSWFERIEPEYTVLWWIPAGSIPGLDEAGERFERLRRDGPGPKAFNFKNFFLPE